MSVTINQILNLPILEQSKILAGADYLTNEVSGITLFDAPDGYKWLRNQEFIVTTGYPFTSTHHQWKDGLLELLRIAVEKKCSGIGIKMGRYIHSLPEEALSYATTHGIPILSIPNNIPWLDLILAVTSIIKQNPILAWEEEFWKKNEIINEILAGTNNNSSLLEKATQIGFPLSNYYLVAVLGKLEEANHCKSQDENLSLLKTIVNNLVETGTDIQYAIDHHGHYVIINPTNNTGPKIEENYRLDLNLLLEKQSSSTFICGIGRIYDGIDKVSKSYKEAINCFNLLQKDNRDSLNNRITTICAFSSLGAERILISENPQDEAKLFAEECLGKIINYDQEKNSQLLTTLITFIENNGNINQTAKVLFVHQNTVRYRLDLIKQLSKLNPENTQDQFAIQMSLAVYKIS